MGVPTPGAAATAATLPGSGTLRLRVDLLQNRVQLLGELHVFRLHLLVPFQGRVLHRRLHRTLDGSVSVLNGPALELGRVPVGGRFRLRSPGLTKIFFAK